MKKILLLFSLSVFVLLGNAQTTVINGTMESWVNPTAADAHPTQWSQIKNGGGACGFCISFAPQGAYREPTTYHGGAYSARIVTGSAFGNVANGTLTTGQLMVPSTDKNEGFIISRRGDANYAMTFTGRPDSLEFWYRSTPSGTDYPGMNVYLHVGNYYVPEAPFNNNHPDSSMNLIGSGFWTGSPGTVVGAWTRVTVPITYNDSRTPQYILLIATSSADQNGGTDGSQFWIDDVSAIFNPTIATGNITPTTYYVSASTGAGVSVPFTLTGTYSGGNTITAQLSDASGSFASPVNIGSVTSTTSGTVSATIPANTASGTGYRIRVVSSSPALTAADNGADVTVVLVGNSIAPSAAQNIAANTNGSMLTVTETPAGNSREWKYATGSGGPYSSFAPVQTGTSYTPNFAGPGTYYVVCVSSFPTGLNITSNEVQINVVQSSIAPTSTQSILVGVDGNTLTVTETPAGSWREWKYATSTGGAYSSFVPAITGATTYTPNFLSAGNYYVVCESMINGVDLVSNEVLISVGNATISTGTITGSPFLFSPSAPDAAVSVPFTTSGIFSGGNVFTAQLSDVSGSFASPVDIGTLSATTSGTISATILHTTLAGTGYRIRVVSDNPVILGSDNGVDLVVDQFNNSIAPATTQTIMHGVNGSAITVTESQTATREWKYSATSGSGYLSFNPMEMGASYTPNFAVPGTYYVVCESTNQYSDAATSNEVQIDVTNGTTITTSAVSGSPYLVSPSANVQVNISFTSDVVFNSGNIFKAQLSDNAGSFANPVEIGTLSVSAIAPVTATIPNISLAGSAYRVRIISTDPAVTGTDNGTDLQIIPFEISIAPVDTQHLNTGQAGTSVAATETHPSTRDWMYSQTPGTGYISFNPVQTGTSYVPQFASPATYYVICKSKNSVSDSLTSQEVVVIVTTPSSVLETSIELIKTYRSGTDLVVDLTAFNYASPSIELLSITGEVVLKHGLNSASVNRIATMLPEGVYVFKIMAGTKTYSGKVQMK